MVQEGTDPGSITTGEATSPPDFIGTELLDRLPEDAEPVTRDRVLQAGREIIQALNSLTSPDRASAIFFEAVQRLVQCQVAAVYVMDEAADLVNVLLFATSRTIPRAPGDSWPLSGSASEQLLKSGGPETWSVLDSEYNLFGTDKYIEAGIKSTLFVPIVFQGRTLGGILLRSQTEDAYQPADLSCISHLATLIGPAVEATIRHQAVQQERQFALALDRVSQSLNSTLDPRQVMEAICQGCSQLLGVSCVSLREVDGEALVRRVAWPPVPGDAPGGDWRQSLLDPVVGLAPRVARSGQAEIVNDPTLRPPNSLDEELMQLPQVNAIMALPLLVRRRVIGVLVTGHAGTGRRFTGQCREMGEAFAVHAAIALQNARLYEATQGYVAQLQESQEDLRESEEKYRRLFEESRDAIYLRDPAGWFIDLNPAAVDLLGYSREELMTLNIIDLCADPPSREAFRREMEERGAVRDLETRLRRKDGARLECLLSATVRRNKDGSLLGYQGIIHDVTERKALEAQFLQAQKMESLGRLAGGIAHDFNNLLAGILGFASLLRSKVPPGSETYEFAQIIEKATLRGSQLTQQLLTAARRGPFDARPMDVNETTHEVVQILSHTLSKDITIVSQLQPNLPLIQGDPSQIHQVLMNLCINAADAMPDGGTLTLANQAAHLDEEYCRQRLSLEPGQYVQVAVSDTGEGISEADRPRIFEPFFSTKEAGKGTGLGLSVVYGIVKNHRGVVEVHSAPDQGSTFTVLLPAIRVSRWPP